MKKLQSIILLLIIINCNLFAGSNREQVNTKGSVSMKYLPVESRKNDASWARYTIVDTNEVEVIWGRDEKSNSLRTNTYNREMKIGVVYNGITSIGDYALQTRDSDIAGLISVCL